MLFEFFNAGPAHSSITDVYFDDGTLLGIAGLIDADDGTLGPMADPDVDFSDSFVSLPVPEPSAALLIGMGLSILASRRR